MKEKEENKIHIVIDNVAVPEVRIGEDEKNQEEKEDVKGLDFDVAIPEYHSGNNK